MGGEVILKVSKPFVPDAKRALERLFEKGSDPKLLWSQAPALDDKDKNSSLAGCWIEWSDRGKNVLQFGYSSSERNREWALALGLEFTRRFKCLRGGFDSVGFCKDFLDARPFDWSVESTRRTMRSYQGCLKNPDSRFAKEVWAEYAKGHGKRQPPMDRPEAMKEVGKLVEFWKKNVDWYRQCGKTYTKAAKAIFDRLEDKA